MIGLAKRSFFEPANDFTVPQRVEVLRVNRENRETVSLDLRAPPGFPQWLPGQFNMLYLFGLGEAAISISGDPSDRSLLRHTVKGVGHLTNAMTKLKEGDSIWIRGPFGRPWPDVTPGFDLLLIAGGIGLAPLRPVILRCLESSCVNRITILYGSRTPSDLLFTDDLPVWAMRSEIELMMTVDRLTDDETSRRWSGAVGVVTHLLDHAVLEPTRTIVMTCGPDVMLRHVVADVLALGICEERIFVSIERNMKCATGICGRCQWGPKFVCRDGPVFSLKDVARFWTIKEF